MYISFDQQSPSARIWIYQADRPLTTQEQAELIKAAMQFCESWAAHNQQLSTSATILHDRFLILSVDESIHAASGCSIDSSVAFVKQAEKAFNLSFFDRTKIAFLHNGEIFMEALPNIKAKVQEGKINADTITFNNLVQTKADLEHSWKVPGHQTWLKKYFV